MQEFFKGLGRVTCPSGQVTGFQVFRFSDLKLNSQPQYLWL